MRIFKYCMYSFFVVIFMASCDSSLLDYDWSGDEDTKRTLKIRLTDGPIDAEEVNVDIQGINIKTNEGFDSVALETAVGIYNLLDFQDGVDTLIGDVIIDFENIKEIRLILGDQNSIKIDGVLHPLIIPSGAETGLKIKVDIDVSNEELVEILLDFDALKSVVMHGNGEYHLKPVIDVKEILIDGQEFENEGSDESGVSCTRGKGYWKTHSIEGPAALDSAWLKIEDLADLLGTGKSYYQFLAESAGNDSYAKLAQQYIIVELNTLAGVEMTDDVADAWTQAAELLSANADSQEIPDAEESLAKELESILKKFNAGDLGPESCDDDEEEDEEEDEDEETEEGVDCTRGKGYWKTHSLEGPAALDSAWLKIEDPSDFFGTGKSYYQFLAESAGNNPYAKLAQAYIIAELNSLAGADLPATVLDAWNEAAEILLAYAASQQITGSDESKSKELESILKKFNAGDLGPISCDDDEEEEEEEEEEENEGLTEVMINTINERFPGASVSTPKEGKLCDGTPILELKINFQSENIYLNFDLAGEVFISYYKKGSESDIPSAINTVLENDFDGFKIKKVYIWTSASGEKSFEIEIQKQSTRKTLHFKSSGEIFCD